jgi:hypothetical protein
MPVMDYQGTSIGRSLLSLRRDTAAMPSGEEADLEAFQRHVATALSELLPNAGDEVLVEIDRQLFCRSTVGSFADQPVGSFADQPSETNTPGTRARTLRTQRAMADEPNWCLCC